MVKAELLYNPYLKTTEVSFNGRSPRINNLVEKYQTQILHDWVSLLPTVFRDEMNGYDFELCFTGTQLDFEDIKKAFEEAGVSDGQVKFFHRQTLEERQEKMFRISILSTWLREHPNHNFDYQSFFEERQELAETTFPVIVMHGGENQNQFEHGWLQTSVEMVDDVNEMRNTDLTHIPILFFIDKRKNKNRL